MDSILTQKPLAMENITFAHNLRRVYLSSKAKKNCRRSLELASHYHRIQQFPVPLDLPRNLTDLSESCSFIRIGGRSVCSEKLNVNILHADFLRFAQQNPDHLFANSNSTM